MSEPTVSDETTNVVSMSEAKERLKNEILNSSGRDLTELLFDDDVSLRDMNDKHAFINSVGGKPMVLCYTYSAIFDRPIVEFRSPASITIQYSNQSVKQERGYIDLGTWWIRHSSRREYDTVVFDPSQSREVKGCLNLYEGMTIKPKKGCWKKTISHIYRVLCNRDAVKFRYTLRWFAWMVQNPGERAEVAIIFRGKEGAGKGFIFTQFLKIYGQHGVNISNREHLTGKFNGHLKQCVFLFADEAYYPGDKSVEGTLKQLITEESIPVEDKYKALGPSKNCLHIGMCTNQEWVIPAGEDSRRYFINEVDNSFAKGQLSETERKNYFTELWGEMNTGGREAMIHDLMSMDLGEWHPRYDVPMTAEMKRQRALSVNKNERYLYSFLEDGMFPGEKIEEGFRIKFEELFPALEKLDNNLGKLSNLVISKHLTNIGCIKSRALDGNFWHFLPLDQCRQLWSEKHGDTDWGIKDENDPIETDWRIRRSAY